MLAKQRGQLLRTATAAAASTDFIIMAGAAGEQRAALGQLDTQQLMAAKRSVEGDVQRYAESLSFFNKSAQIYMQAGKAVANLADSKEGQGLLLPLTQSLYVSGEVASVDKVLVDIGTNYYVEMTTVEAREYLGRKLLKLQGSMNELQQVLRVKQNQLVAVERELGSRQAAGAAAGAARA